MREPPDLENLVITHPKILKLLSTGDRDPYFLCKQLGISYRVCYSHLHFLEKAGLTGGKFRYHLTEKGRQILSRLDPSPLQITCQETGDIGIGGLCHCTNNRGFCIRPPTTITRSGNAAASASTSCSAIKAGSATSSTRGSATSTTFR
jgi:hypothetical protein